MFRSLSLAIVASSLLSVGTANAATLNYNLNFTGTQEVSGGDPDGTGTGTITINDITGQITWNISYFNIIDPTAMHIHGPGGVPGVNVGVAVNLGVAGNTAIDTLFGSTSPSPATALAINTTPGGYYVNIHNSAHPGGAIRSQLNLVPEPTSLALLSLGGLLVLRRRRVA